MKFSLGKSRASQKYHFQYKTASKPTNRQPAAIQRKGLWGESLVFQNSSAASEKQAHSSKASGKKQIARAKGMRPCQQPQRSPTGSVPSKRRKLRKTVYNISPAATACQKKRGITRRSRRVQRSQRARISKMIPAASSTNNAGLACQANERSSESNAKKARVPPQNGQQRCSTSCIRQWKHPAGRKRFIR